MHRRLYLLRFFGSLRSVAAGLRVAGAVGCGFGRGSGLGSSAGGFLIKPQRLVPTMPKTPSINVTEEMLEMVFPLAKDAGSKRNSMLCLPAGTRIPRST